MSKNHEKFYLVVTENYDDPESKDHKEENLDNDGKIIRILDFDLKLFFVLNTFLFEWKDAR